MGVVSWHIRRTLPHQIPSTFGRSTWKHTLIHLALCARNIVHPNFFLHKTLLIPILFPEIIIHRIASTENNNIIHNILTTQTGINVFLFFQVSSHECKIVEAHVRC